MECWERGLERHIKSEPVRESGVTGTRHQVSAGTTCGLDPATGRYNRSERSWSRCATPLLSIAPTRQRHHHLHRRRQHTPNQLPMCASRARLATTPPSTAGQRLAQPHHPAAKIAFDSCTRSRAAESNHRVTSRFSSLPFNRVLGSLPRCNGGVRRGLHVRHEHMRTTHGAGTVIFFNLL